MTESDLLQALARGEDSRQQFKRDATNADGMAAELAALANSSVGTVFLGMAHIAHITPEVTPEVTPQVAAMLLPLMRGHAKQKTDAL